MKLRHFEDLDAWQTSRELVRKVYDLTLKDNLRKDFGFVDQFRRAAVSAMSNIAEGFERGSDNEFVRFLFIARGSIGEVRSLLYVALDQHYIREAEFEETSQLCVRLSQMIWGLIRYLRQGASKASNSSKTSKTSES